MTLSGFRGGLTATHAKYHSCETATSKHFAEVVLQESGEMGGVSHLGEHNL